MRDGAHHYWPLDVVIERAEGVWLFDVEGRRYLDFLSSYSALNQGHRHPRIIAAVREQLEKITLSSSAIYHVNMPAAYQAIKRITGMDKVLLMNSGAEAVETAIKAARKWGYTVKGVPRDRAEIIVCEGNFHGRTTTIISFSTERQYRELFGPHTPGFVTVPFGSIEAMERAVTKNTVAVLIEPIQGEAGIRIPPAGYLKAVRQLCTRERIMMIADEIQSGLGRCGSMFACDYEGVKPDAYLLGKALSGGIMPISAVASIEELLGVFEPGDHGSTFGANPLACAIIPVALDVIIEEKLPERSARLGEYLYQRIKAIRSPVVREVRGRGLWIGIELVPSAGPARRYCEELLAYGIVCKDAHDHVIRLAPPLTIKKRELDYAVNQLRNVLTV
jgi:ornithine--oxo-acid transaminase